MTAIGVATFSVIFRSEIRHANQRGWKIGVDWTDTGITIGLKPVTQRTKTIAARSNHPGGHIQATAAWPQGQGVTFSDKLDVTRATITAALELANDSGA